MWLWGSLFPSSAHTAASRRRERAWRLLWRTATARTGRAEMSPSFPMWSSRAGTAWHVPHVRAPGGSPEVNPQDFCGRVIKAEKILCNVINRCFRTRKSTGGIDPLQWSKAAASEDVRLENLWFYRALCRPLLAKLCTPVGQFQALFYRIISK